MIDGVALEQIGSQFTNKTTKFLGIYMDDSLTWKHHLTHVNNKISRALYGIKQANNVLPNDGLKTLYTSLIQPYLSYGILAWGNARPTSLNKTLLLQKRAVRIICNSGYNSHTEPLFKSCQIFKLNDLYEFNVCLFMQDFKLKKLPRSFDDIFQFNNEIQNDIVTRQSSLFYISRCNSTFSRNLPYYTFPVTWNTLNGILSECKSRSQTKHKMKNYILSKYAEFVKCNSKYCRQCHPI